MVVGSQQAKAQDRLDDDSLNVTKFDNNSVVVDTTFSKKEMKQDWSTWRPDPKRALWLALVIPGGGQIYNRKYWKLPLVYGGFIGCMYAMNWNNTMYKDYSQAYIDLMDNDPSTQSYNQFLHLGMKITTDADKKRYQDIFRDAELSVFDISDDLSLRVEPTIINNRSSSNPLDASSVGLQCSLNF